MLSSTCIFSAMLCYYCVIIDKTTTPYLGLFYGINPQPYLISSSSIKLIAKTILFFPFLWNKFKLQILVKKVHLIIIREWTKSNCPFLKNLYNFLSATFYLTPPPPPTPTVHYFSTFYERNPKPYLIFSFWTI